MEDFLVVVIVRGKGTDLGVSPLHQVRLCAVECPVLQGLVEGVQSVSTTW